MKTDIAVLGLVALASAVFAEIPAEWPLLKTNDGKEYHHAKLRTIEPSGIKITHDAGLSRIPFEELPDDVRTAFKYDPEKAAAYKAKTAAAQQAALEQMEADKAKARAIELGGSSQPPQPAVKPGRKGKAGKASAEPETVAGVGSVEIRAQHMSGGRSTDTTWQTTYGSYNKTITGKHGIGILLTTQSRSVLKVVVEWAMISKDPATNQKFITPGKSEKAELVQGTPSAHYASMSADSQDDKYAALGIREQSGEEYRGWVVRAKNQQGQVIAVAASLPEYAKYAREDWKKKP